MTNGPGRSQGSIHLRSGRQNRAVQGFAVARLGWGIALLSLRPSQARSLSLPSDKRMMMIARLLGLRHLIQAVCTRTRPSRQVGVVVDMVHSVSMLLVALSDAKRRKAALLDAAVAGGFAIVGLATVTANQGVDGDTPGPDPQGWLGPSDSVPLS